MAPSEALQTGTEELRRVVEAMGQLGVPQSAFGVDLGVVRGLDYYTGTIYETQLVGHPDIGSICSGGRYDDLASYFTDTRLPGVGISIGLTRLFAKLSEAGLLRPLASTPAQAIVITMDGRFLGRYLEMATKLRDAGVNTEVYLEQAKLRNQMAYADRKGFRVAVIAGEDEFARDAVQVKNLVTQQATVHPLGELVRAVQATLNDAKGQG
jgi:histidyl-tRNA synthetase